MGNLLGTGQGKTVATQAVRANGLQVQASNYGMGLPIVYGRARVPGTLIWYGDFQAVEHDQQVGKGGGGGQNVSYTYSSSFQLALCESDGTLTLGKIWKDSGLVSLSDINGTFGSGAGSQAAWSHLSGAAALQYPFTAWVGCLNILLGSSPTISNFNFEINGLLQFNPGGGIYDADPSAIVNDLMTSVTHGIGFSYLGDLTTFQDYCLANSILLSLVVDQETSMTDVLTNLLQITNSNTAWSNGKLVIIPYGDEPATGNGKTYTPPTTVQASFSDKDYIGAGVKVDRKPLADQYNVIRIEWVDPTNNYVTSVAEAKDQADIDASSIRQSETIQAHSITNATLAQQTAQRILQRALYIRNTYTFTTTMQYVALEPGDAIEISDSLIGLVNEPVRITEVAEQENNELQFTCEEFPAGVSEGATQSVEAASGFAPNVNGAPDTTQPPVIFRAPQFLVDGAVEIWIGACGSGSNWGGANVLVSYDNVTYTKIGSVRPGCRYGTLTAALADSSADPDTTNSFSVALEGPGSLSGGAHAEADNLATLMLVDQELVAYSSTTLNGDGTYTLGNGYLRRQCYNTAHAAHAIGAPWMRVDDNFFRWTVDPSLVGTTVYIKLQAWNLYGGGLQSEASLTPTTYVIGAAEEIPDTPPVPSNFAATGTGSGVHLAWSNTNPAAVGITSVEYSTDGSTWSILGQVQGTHYNHSFTGNKTYYYRARARSPSFIWSAYTATATGAALTGNLLSTSSWKIGASGSQGNYIDRAIGGGGPASVVDMAGTAGVGGLKGPYGDTCPLWIGYPGSLGQNEGGWENSGDLRNIDPTKGLMMSVWINNTEGLTSGQFYFGCDDVGNTDNLDGSANTNPYFAYQNCSLFATGKWYLWVGVIHGSGYNGSNSGLSGVYDPSSGQQIYAGTDFVMKAGATQQQHRAFLFYSTDSASKWCALSHPRVDVMDGSQPTIASLLATNLDGFPEGQTWGRFKLAYRDTSGRVSTMDGGMSPYGSIPPVTANGAFSYTSTTTSVTISWASMTVYRSDGTTTTVPSGNTTVSSLSASTTYTFYPYIRESDATIQFSSGKTYSTGSPAIAYTQASADGAAVAYQYANASMGSFSAATPASGTGGGGGSLQCCLNSEQMIELADGSTVRAAELLVGQYLTSPTGPTLVRHARTEAWGEWFRVTLSNGVSLLVAGDHRFMSPAGEQLTARDLNLQQVVQAREGYVFIAQLEALWFDGEKVSVEVSDTHTYYVQGILSHNKEMCAP